MTLEQIYYISQVVAVLAIFASLLFVGIQVRQNTATTRAVLHQSFTGAMNHLNATMAQSPELSRIWLKGFNDRAALNEVERWQFDMLLLSYFHVFDSMHYQTRTGVGESKLMKAEESGLRTLISQPSVRSWWNENPYGFSPEFRAYAEGLARPKNEAGQHQ
jgi:hypothetical protein